VGQHVTASRGSSAVVTTSLLIKSVSLGTCVLGAAQVNSERIGTVPGVHATHAGLQDLERFINVPTRERESSLLSQVAIHTHERVHEPSNVRYQVQCMHADHAQTFLEALRMC
jgi:hypothetical protein